MAGTVKEANMNLKAKFETWDMNNGRFLYPLTEKQDRRGIFFAGISSIKNDIERLKKENNMLHASISNALQTAFEVCEECGVYKEKTLVCWNCHKDV